MNYKILSTIYPNQLAVGSMILFKTQNNIGLLTFYEAVIEKSVYSDDILWLYFKGGIPISILEWLRNILKNLNLLQNNTYYTSVSNLNHFKILFNYVNCQNEL